MAISQIHIYICLPDRNYVQEDSCLPDQASIQEDLADTAPLAHDDLGCPIRRDRLFHQDNMGATAKPLSGPPVSPSLFRSPRSSATERPSPKAIQASIKESATLAAAISMQWKEEVSAMRRELAELRRDLCKELRAFNSNFNTFTQHYNTWSPQGGSMAAGAGLGGGTAAGAGTGTRAGAGAGTGAGLLGTSVADRSTGGARDKIPQISKVSVGTQARSKVLVRQSTADAAVNCPEEKEEKKGGRRSLPKQLSMDPSILACPQSMYVESAIPLSLDPILPSFVRAAQPEPSKSTAVPSTTELEPELKLRNPANVKSSDVVTVKPVTIHGTEPHLSEAVVDSKSLIVEQEIITPQLIYIGPDNKSHSATEPSHLDTTTSPDSEKIDRDKIDTIEIPYPVPVVTVSPPEEFDYDIMSDSESPDPLTVDKSEPVSQDPTTVSVLHSELEDPEHSDLTELQQSNLPPVSSSTPIYQDPPSQCDVPTVRLDTVTPCHLTDFTCPSIVVSEYFDIDSPNSPTGSDTILDPIVTFPECASDLPSEQISSDSTLASSPVETQPNTEQVSQDSEWPPLPEPLDTSPIYHADLVHFDLVMLTSLDQDDLDSVFMDPEPEPFDMSIDSSSNAEDLDPPMCQSGQSSPLTNVDPAFMSPLDSSQSPTEFVCLDPAMEYRLAHMPQDIASELHEFPLPHVTVTISPPSSVSPDTSVEIDFGPTSPDPDPPLPEFDSSDLQDIPSAELPCIEREIIPEVLECMAGKHDSVEQEESPGSPKRSSSDQAFLWCRWQKRTQRRDSMHRSASVELWSGRYEYNSAEITYVSLTL